MRVAIAASVVLAACLYAERSAAQTSAGSAKKTRSEKYLQACLDGGQYVDPDTGYRFDCDESQLDAVQLQALRAKRQPARPGARETDRAREDAAAQGGDSARERREKAPVEEAPHPTAEQRRVSAVEPANATAEAEPSQGRGRKLDPTRVALSAERESGGEKSVRCKVTYRPGLVGYTGTKSYSPQGPVSLRRNVYFFQDQSGSPVSLPAERTTVEGCGFDAPTPAPPETRTPGGT